MMKILVLALGVMNRCHSAPEIVQIVVTITHNLYQREIFELLTSNSSCGARARHFVWRDNAAAKSLRTSFGVLRLPSEEFSSYKICSLRYMDSVKSVDLDGSYDISLHRSDFSGGTPISMGLDGSDIQTGGFRVITTPKPHRQLESKSSLVEGKEYSIPFIPASVLKVKRRQRYAGQGVKIAIFDSGLNANHPHFANISDRINWTHDTTADDLVGHGSFVAGVVAGTSQQCPGIAPMSKIYMFRVFSTTQQSYTSWFLDAFNYALFLGIDVINFSIGGPDHADVPFTDKIKELAANGVIIITAVGNDGPLWGTVLNPADLGEVLSVGGWGGEDSIARFSSRGMTTSELSNGGIGRVKPDILAPSVSLFSSSNNKPFRCVSLSGTSVAAPVIAGAVAVLLSSAFVNPLSYNGTVMNSQGSSNKLSMTKEHDRTSPKFLRLKNIATMKQILMTSARRLETPGIFEQGLGVLDLDAAFLALEGHQPHVSLIPQKISNLPEDCPYLWPWCRTPIYHNSQPLLLNFTILNSMGITGQIVELKWIEKEKEKEDGVKDKKELNRSGVRITFDKNGIASKSHIKNYVHQNATTRLLKEVNRNRNRNKNRNEIISKGSNIVIMDGKRVTLRVQFSDILYPYVGHIAVSLSATKQKHTESHDVSDIFTGRVNGKLHVTVQTHGPPLIFPDEKDILKGDEYKKKSSENSFTYDAIKNVQTSTAVVDFSLLIIPTPIREKRILWDIYHNIGYPSAFVPRDDLDSSRNNFDWMGDHPYTNYKGVYERLLQKGYYVEILRSPWTCFNATDYHTLLVVDPEEAFGGEEINKLVSDIRVHGLSVIIIADWYDELVLHKEIYKDDNTRSTWHPITGGSNIPAINRLLDRFDAQIGLQSFKGKFNFSGSEVSFLSGNVISQWPKDGIILKSGHANLRPNFHTNLRMNHNAVQAVAGYLEVKHSTETTSLIPSPSLRSGVSSAHANSPLLPEPIPEISGYLGRIVVYGDNSCFDLSTDAREKIGCEKLIDSFLQYVKDGSLPINSKFSKKGKANDVLSDFSTSSEYEILDKIPYFSPLQLNVSNVMKKQLEKELQRERTGRAWEFSRYSKVSDESGKDKITSYDDICYTII